MSYPVYNSATVLAASTAASIPNNKGLLIVNTHGSAVGTAVVYPTTPDGSRGTAITISIAAAVAPVIFPVRIHSTGAYSNVGVYELT